MWKIVRSISTQINARTANVRFGARGAVARRKGITNLDLCTPQNFYCQPPLRQAAFSLAASERKRRRESLTEKEVHLEIVG